MMTSDENELFLSDYLPSKQFDEKTTQHTVVS